MSPRRSKSLSYHHHHHHNPRSTSTIIDPSSDYYHQNKLKLNHNHLHHPIHSRILLPLLHSQPQSIQSLDLPISSPFFSLLSLYSFLIHHLNQIELTLQSIDSIHLNDHHQPPPPPPPSNHPTILRSPPYSSSQAPSPSSSSSSTTTTTTTTTTFVQQVTRYVNQLKLDLFSSQPIDVPLHHPLPSSTSYPYCSLPDLNHLNHPLDRLSNYLNSIPDPNQLLQLLTVHSQKLDELLSHSPSRFIIDLPFIFPESLSALIPQPPTPSNEPKPDHRLSSPINLRQYFLDESDRLSSLLPSLPSGLSESLAQSSNHITSAFRACKVEAQAVLHDGEVFFREEGEKLKEWVDSETEKLRLALQMGTSRLLTYHELPDEWKNNRFIVKGYRFIPLDRWHHLLLSGIQWHNETINIHTHFFGTLSLFYLLFFLWPKTPHTALDSSTLTDRVISLIFLVCAIKCLICSTAWHLFAGCGTLGPFKRLACVDYVGISGLIAASVMSMEYYGFYCRPGLAAVYMSFTVLMGVIGMILPFKPFFDRPESKGIRILFFVSMAGSALIPQAHMAYLYGLRQTFNFYYPAYYSVISYLAGLVFYATNWPERVKPGWVFDTLFHSHQFWHVAIVVAIWLH